MTEQTPGRFRRLLTHTTRTVFTATVATLASIVVTTLAVFAARPFEVEVQTPGPAVIVTAPFATANPDAEPEPGAMGWTPPTAEELAANLDPQKTLQFDATPAGRAATGDEDVFLWQAVRKVNNKGPPWYPNVDQKNVGCCVGCGWKHSVDVCQATQILAGKRAEWKPVSVEAIYGMSRVDIGGGQIRGDGSVGAWAADAIRKEGVAPMEKIGDVDLTTFNPARAREWGSKGVPAAVKAAAKDHAVKSTALVKSWADVKRSIQQGYPVAVCSNVGFDASNGTVGVRDADGFIASRGTWNHCMCIIAVRSSSREGGFILNSWGDGAHRGPVWPADMPVAGFWAEAATIERMVKQGDSFALADIAGFPARRVPLDWFIHAKPRRVDAFDRSLRACSHGDAWSLAA